MESNADLDKKAAEELLREAKRAAARASVGGALAWQKCPLPPTNKLFLHNTVCSVLITNKLKERKRQETIHKQEIENRKRSRSSARNESEHQIPKNQKSESKALKDMKKFKYKCAKKTKEHKGEFKQSKSNDARHKKHNR